MTTNRKMLLSALLLIPVVLALEQEKTINNHTVKINGDTLISVYSTPTSHPVLNLSGLGLKILTENAFANLTTLKSLDLGNNSLFSIPKGAFSQLGNLENLSLAYNYLTYFEKIFEGLHRLKTLNISNNPLNSLRATALFGLPRSSIVFTKGLSFEVINAFVFEKEPGILFKSNMLDEEIINNVQNPTRHAQEQDGSAEVEDRRKRVVHDTPLIKICIDGDVLEKVELLTNTEILLSHCYRGQLSKPRLLDLKNLGIAKFAKNWYGLNTTTSITRIHFGKNNIVRLTPELVNDLPENIINIDLRHNKIEQLERDVLENPHIRVINLRSNAIRNIEDSVFAKMPRLSYLQLDENLLDNTRFMATLPGSIETLRVSRNQITEISPHSFDTLGGLMYLYLYGNLIREVESDSLHGLGPLTELILSDNLISKVGPGSFQHVTDIRVIALNNNNISRFENNTFDNLPNLVHLDVSYNKLLDIKKSFPNGVPPNLTILNLGFNEIEKLERGNFKNQLLTTLVLSGNKISEIEHRAFDLPALRELNLDNNRLDRLNGDSFCGLININMLNLAYNSIPSIPKKFPAEMNHLEELDLSYNPIHRLQNGALYGFRRTAYNNVFLREVPIEIIEGGLFDDM